jgi:hypothetical protein
MRFIRSIKGEELMLSNVFPRVLEESYRCFTLVRQGYTVYALPRGAKTYDILAIREESVAGMLSTQLPDASKIVQRMKTQAQYEASLNAWSLKLIKELVDRSVHGQNCVSVAPR